MKPADSNLACSASTKIKYHQISWVEIQSVQYIYRVDSREVALKCEYTFPLLFLRAVPSQVGIFDLLLFH